MNFLKTTINGSPFVGIFCSISNSVAIVPHSIQKKTEKEISSELSVKIIKTTMANSSLIGVLGVVFGEKAMVPEIVEKQEKKNIEQQGLEVKQADEALALGNLVAMNSTGGIASTILSKKTVMEMQKFFEVPFIQLDIAGSKLVGACIEATDKGFIVNPSISEKEFALLEKTFNVQGVTTTANYGDMFVGNDIAANNKGALIGAITTTHEMIRIDEAFRR